MLDDVSSELDRDRNEFLFDFLRERENQCFITTTHPDWVLLARDDGSVDGTLEILNELARQEPRMAVERADEGGG